MSNLVKDGDVIQASSEVSQSRSIVDPRTFYAKLWDSLQAPWIPLLSASISALITVFWSGWIPFGILIQFILWLAVTGKPDVLPIHLPMEAGKLDKNDPRPAESGYYKSRGSFFVGNIRISGSNKMAEVWMSFKSLTQHFLILGTTGSGKTESIVSYICNYLSVGSGVAFQDAKAAPKAMVQMATFCRIFGRDHDFRVTNYITGNLSGKRDPAERISNDSAIFARGSAESSTQLLVSLLPASEGDNKIFSEKAISLVSALLPALTDLRDLGKLQIDPGVVRENMAFKVFATLFRNNNISKKSRDALKGFLESLPGYDENVEVLEQKEEVSRQFGFAQAYFTRSLASLSDTYGHIYMVGLGEIDYQDAVLNGRILMTLLPSLEKSGEELSSLGKIVLTATRNGMVVGLGTIFEGSSDDVVYDLPTNTEIPYGVMNDENAYMLVEGQEMINAQARGLNFGVMTGTQDAPGMLENISRTTKQIMANSAIKQLMYLDDKETIDLAIEFSGEANVLVRDGYEREGDMGDFFAGKNARLEKRYRISSTALKSQGLGQAFLMYQGKIHTVQLFNHGISDDRDEKDPLKRFVSSWFSVRMAKIAIPTSAELVELMNVSSRREYQDLMMLIRDDSRLMLSEMNRYFQSMLVIERMAREKIVDKSMVDTVYGAQNVLDGLSVYEKPVGILGLMEASSLKSFADVNKFFLLMLKSDSSPSFANHREAELEKSQAAQGLELDDDSDLFVEQAESFLVDNEEAQQEERLGRESGGYDGLELKPQPAIDIDDPLNAFLGESITGLDSEDDDSDEWVDASEADTTGHEVAEHEQEDQRDNSDREPLSAVAKITKRNLAFMPWFGSDEEMSEAREAMIQTELFLTDSDDVDLAAESVDRGFSLVADAFDYPKTSMPKQEDLNLSELLAGLKDN